jgi:hypothetical protein
MPFAIKIGTEHAAIDAGRCLNSDYALRRNARPVGYRWLGDANRSRKRADAAGSTNRFVEARIAHGRDFFVIPI